MDVVRSEYRVLFVRHSPLITHPLIPFQHPNDVLQHPSSGLVHVGPNTFPVLHALGSDCGQQQVYQRCVMPLLMLFLEGFDASVIVYGHAGTGKR